MDTRQDPIVAVFRTLKQIGDEKFGHGWKEMLNRGLNRATGYVTKDINKKTMRLATLFEVLQLLEEDPQDFFAKALAEIAEPSFGSAALLRGTPNPVASAEVERLTRKTRPTETPEEADLWDPPLDLVQMRRRSNPESAALLVESTLDLVRDGGLPNRLILPLLLEWSACQLRIHRNDHAHAALCFVHESANALGARYVRADALLRLTEVALRLSADAEVALTIANESYLQFSDVGSASGIGKAMLIRARHLFHLGQIESSARNFLLALDQLPAESPYRCSAHQSLGLLYLEQGDYGPSRQHLDVALALSQEDRYEQGTAIWTRARLAAHLGEFSQAVEGFRLAREKLSAPAPIQAVLASLDLAELHLVNGSSEAAAAVTKELIPLLQPLRIYPVIEGVVLGLLRITISGATLTLETLQNASRKIRKTEPVYR